MPAPIPPPVAADSTGLPALARTVDNYCMPRWPQRPWTHCRYGHELTEDNVFLNHGYPQCRQCHRDQFRRYSETASWEVKNRRRLKARFGITPETLTDIWEAQGRRCAICRDEIQIQTRSCCVDHDHSSGRVRGLLCNPCNRFLGRVEHDTHGAVAILRATERYLSLLDA